MICIGGTPMRNIYARYSEFRDNRLCQLQGKIIAVINNITDVTYDLPQNRILDLFKHYPAKSLTLKWVLQDKGITFTFNGDEDVDIKIGKEYQITSDFIKNCNELLNEFEYGLTLEKTGWCHIHNGKTELHFSAEEGTLLRNIKRFKEDILEAFPDCEFHCCLSFDLTEKDKQKCRRDFLTCKIEDYDDHCSCDGKGWISIQIKM